MQRLSVALSAALLSAAGALGQPSVPQKLPFLGLLTLQPRGDSYFKICLEGNESGTYFRGRARLQGGRAEIAVPEEWKLVSEKGGSRFR